MATRGWAGFSESDIKEVERGRPGRGGGGGGSAGKKKT